MSKQGETLEQRARRHVREAWVVKLEQLRDSEQFKECELCKAVRPDLLHEFLVEAHISFARDLLEEARPYMKHKALCKAMYWNGPCSCGLAELLEGWR